MGLSTLLWHSKIQTQGSIWLWGSARHHGFCNFSCKHPTDSSVPYCGVISPRSAHIGHQAGYITLLKRDANAAYRTWTNKEKTRLRVYWDRRVEGEDCWAEWGSWWTETCKDWAEGCQGWAEAESSRRPRPGSILQRKVENLEETALLVEKRCETVQQRKARLQTNIETLRRRLMPLRTEHNNMITKQLQERCALEDNISSLEEEIELLKAGKACFSSKGGYTAWTMWLGKGVLQQRSYNHGNGHHLKSNILLWAFANIKSVMFQFKTLWTVITHHIKNTNHARLMISKAFYYADQQEVPEARRQPWWTNSWSDAPATDRKLGW